MFGLDSVSSALDTASQMLAGGSNNPTAATTATANFVRGIHIDAEDPDIGGATAHNLNNERDLNHLLEFIHFGNVHTSYSNFFPHPVYKDNEEDKAIVANSKPRAIQFRSALEREAVLLSLFMESMQTVLQDRTDAQGVIGTVMDTLGSLTGAGGGGSGQTTAADLNAPIQQVVTAIKPALVELITYPNTHQAGRDMHQARANYRAILAKIIAEKPSSDAKSSLVGGLMGAISSGLKAAGPIGDVINFAQGIATKPEDIKVKFFARVAAQQEVQIETACHAMTLQAITSLLNPVLPVWFGDPNAKATQPKWDAPDSPIQRENDSSNLLKNVINPVADKVNSARQSAMDAGNSVKSFFETPTPPTPPPGTPFLDQAFDVPPPPANKTDPMPMAMSALAVQAFIDALGLSSPLNSFCEGVISKVFGVTLDFIHATYVALLARSSDEAITDESLYTAAKEDLQIGTRLLALASEQVTFISKAQSLVLDPGIMGYKVNAGQLIDKETKKIDELVANVVSPLLDDTLKLAMAGLAGKLDLARTDGNDNKCLTMEWYLGRLPWVEATLFFDLFFPFWNALLQCVMKVVDPAAASVIKSILGVANTAKNAVDSARDDIEKAKALQKSAQETQQKLSDGVNLLDPSKIGGLDTGYGSDLKKKASQTTAPQADRGKFTLAVTLRSVTGKALEVPQSPDYDQVFPQHKWEGAPSAIDPATTPDSKAAGATPG